MAQILIKGDFATVELTTNPLDGGLTAKCIGHKIETLTSLRPGACDWTATYDDMDDATEYAAGHADRGDMR